MPAPAAEVQGPYILLDAATGTVLDDRDALRPWYPASTTKLMTAYVALRAVEAGELTLQSPVTISARAAAEPASKMGFKPGSVLTLEDALKIIMVKSANDIALAVAETVAGSEAAFAERMNAEAQRLGMLRSRWTNPHGLPDPNQVTTARDMAVLGRALLNEFPQHRQLFRIHAIEVGGKVLENFNPLIERYPGATGMKTGFICASGYNLVASAERGGREMIAVVFGEYGATERAEHAAQLLDAGFQAPPAAPGRGTLDSVASGQEYASPLDMRPLVCGPGRAQTAADSAKVPAPAEAAADPAAAAGAALSALTPPMFLGPPVKITVLAPQKYLKPGQPGFLARIPKPRPAHPSDPIAAEIVDVLAPVGAALRAVAAPSAAAAAPPASSEPVGQP